MGVGSKTDRSATAYRSWPIGAAAVLLAGMALLSGCSARGGHIPYGGANLGVPDRPTPEDTAYDEPLEPLDVLHVTVFRVPDLTGDYQVDAHGMVDMPLIGKVSARDMSPEAFAARLRAAYGERYLNDPDITVRVTATNSSNVTVEGGVNQAGVYALPGRTTLEGAIALAHGLDQTNGNPRRVAVFRKQNGHTVAAEFDLVAIHKGDMTDPVIYPGDTILVDSDRLRELYRDLVQTLPAIAIFHAL